MYGLAVMQTIANSRTMSLINKIDIIVSVKNLLTERTMSIDNKTPNGLSLSVEKIKRVREY